MRYPLAPPSRGLGMGSEEYALLEARGRPSRALSLRLLALAFCLAPWAPLKLGLLAAGLAAGVSAVAAGARVDRVRCAWVAGAIAWILVVVSPYWLLAPTPPLRMFALGLTAALLWIWIRLAAAPLRLRRVPVELSGLVATFAILLLFLWPGLTAPIEYGGDEDWHLAWPYRALRTLQRLDGARAAALAIVLSAGTVLCALRPRFGRTAILWSLALLPLLLLVGSSLVPPPPAWLSILGRYPPGGAWLSTAAAFSPLHLLPLARAATTEEALYRLLPIASTLLVAAWAYGTVAAPTWCRALVALAIGTVPTIAYYSTTLYPDWPAAALLTVALRGFDVGAADVLRGRERLRLALLVSAGAVLVKETMVALVALVVIGYALHAVWPSRGDRRLAVARSARLAFIVLGPGMIYVAWRVIAVLGTADGSSPLGVLGAARSYRFDPSPLLSPQLYVLGARALREQVGVALLVAAVGLWSTARRPRRLIIWLFAAVGVMALLAGDYVRETERGRLPQYWGYSRFLLIVLPVILNLIVEGFRRLARRSVVALATTALLVLAGNVRERPLGWDGSRPPFWGDYVTPGSGERFPYPDLYAWLAAEGATGELLILGRGYSYRDDFYLDRNGLRLDVRAVPPPRARRTLLTAAVGPEPLPAWLLDALGEAEHAPRARYVVVHLESRFAPEALPATVGRLARTRTFTLGRSALVAYVRAPG